MTRLEELDKKFEDGELSSIELAIWWLQDTNSQESALRELDELREWEGEAERVIGILGDVSADNARLAAELKAMHEKYEVCWEEPGETSPALIMHNSAHKWKF